MEKMKLKFTKILPLTALVLVGCGATSDGVSASVPDFETVLDIWGVS